MLFRGQSLFKEYVFYEGKIFLGRTFILRQYFVIILKDTTSIFEKDCTNVLFFEVSVEVIKLSLECEVS